MSHRLNGSEDSSEGQRVFRLFQDRHWTLFLCDFLIFGSWTTSEFIVLWSMQKGGVEWSQVDLNMFLFVFCLVGGKGKAKGELGGRSDFGRMFLNFKRKENKTGVPGWLSWFSVDVPNTCAQFRSWSSDLDLGHEFKPGIRLHAQHGFPRSWDPQRKAFLNGNLEALID